MSPLLTASNLTCIRNERILFDNLSFSLNAGEVLHVTGANGSGKSSLLKILCRLITPEKGAIFWRGEKLGPKNLSYQHEIAYLGHKLGVKHQLTILENLNLISRLGQLQKNINVEKILKTLGLFSYKNTLRHQLSAGQQQKVALAKFYLIKAKLWILDEPFTALDQPSILNFYDLLQIHIQQEGLLVLTSHTPLSPDFFIKRLVIPHET